MLRYNLKVDKLEVEVESVFCFFFKSLSLLTNIPTYKIKQISIIS